MNVRASLRHYLIRSDGGVLFFVLLFTLAGFLTRLVLLVKAAPAVSFDVSLAAVFGWGFV